jgi:hypothetical protein
MTQAQRPYAAVLTQVVFRRRGMQCAEPLDLAATFAGFALLRFPRTLPRQAPAIIGPIRVATFQALRKTNRRAREYLQGVP